MRSRFLPLILSFLAACSSSEGPPESGAPVDAELAGMPRIGLQEVAETLDGRLERPVVIVLWEVEMPGTDAKAFLGELDAFAKRHAEAAEVWALNVDLGSEAADAAELVREREPSFEARAFQGDRMGLGFRVGWGGGPTPVAALFGRDGRRKAKLKGGDVLEGLATALERESRVGNE
jgi:hypothetical protein